MPRSLTVLSVCASAAWAERPAARARVRARVTRFMGYAFQSRLKVRNVVFAIVSAGSDRANPMIPCRHSPSGIPNPAGARRRCRSPVRRWIEGRGRPLNMRRLNSTCITERLASRVKGLTALFCVLLLTTAARPAAAGTARRGCGNASLEQTHGFLGHRLRPQQAETRLVTSGRDTKAQKGFVNPPVFHGSTVLYPTAEDLHAHRGEFQYGRHGTPTTRALQETLMALEGPQCAGVGIAPSGLSAISTTLLSVLKAGDHLLVCDNVYRPTRNFCNGMLARYGVETTYFDPLIGAGIDEAVQAEHQRGAGRGARLAILRDARHSAPSPRSRMRAARSSSTTTPGRRRCITARSNRASTSACRPRPNISAAIPTSCSAPSRPMPRPGR